jgi:phenylacetate-coenzyme A ligase PaaK-like adenylate-forming protein
MDNYLLKQIDQRFVDNWNSHYNSDDNEDSILEKIKNTSPTRLIHSEPLTLSRNGHLCFFTSGTSGQETYFEMGLNSLEGIYAKGLASMYEKLFSISAHRIKSAILAFPMTGSPLGLKHLFSLLELGVDVYPAGNRNLDFKPNQVVDVISKKKIELLVSRPLEVELYARIAEEKEIKLDSVMGILLTGEVVTKKRLDFIKMKYPNAHVHAVYGLTEINSGLFSCECGNYHFQRNGQTIVELEPSGGNNVNDVYFTVLRPDLSVIRYHTRDKASYIHSCECGSESEAMMIRGRDSDEIAEGYFISDFSDNLLKHNIEHNVFADITPKGEYKLIIKSKGKISEDYLEHLRQSYKHLVIEAKEFDDCQQYIPLIKSCTLHSGASNYE